MLLGYSDKDFQFAAQTSFKLLLLFVERLRLRHFSSIQALLNENHALERYNGLRVLISLTSHQTHYV